MRGPDEPAPVYLMGGARVGNSGRRFRRTRRLRKAQRGVVAVIGTLLALLVFFALFGIFLTQYVPLWMTDNESQFTSQAATSFAQLKSYVDSQYLSGGPAVYGTPFTISSQGIPLLAQPTEGTLVFIPSTCPGGFYSKGVTGATSSNYGQPVVPTFCVFQNISLSTGPSGSAMYSQHVESGVLEMVLPNRYYTGQTFYYEDDGVIQSQGGAQQIMLVPPPFNVTTVGTNTSVTTSFLQLYGNATTIIGQGSEQVFSHLRYTQTVASNGKMKNGIVQVDTLNVTFEVGTQNPCAWEHQLWAQMNVSGMTYKLNPTKGSTQPTYNWTSEAAPFTATAGSGVNLACSVPNGQTTIIALNMHSVDYASVFYAGVQFSLGVGGT
jgi:type II secretory pathway pseudopilin PulG